MASLTSCFPGLSRASRPRRAVKPRRRLHRGVLVEPAAAAAAAPAASASAAADSSPGAASWLQALLARIFTGSNQTMEKASKASKRACIHHVVVSLTPFQPAHCRPAAGSP